MLELCVNALLPAELPCLPQVLQMVAQMSPVTTRASAHDPRLRKLCSDGQVHYQLLRSSWQTSGSSVINSATSLGQDLLAALLSAAAAQRWPVCLQLLTHIEYAHMVTTPGILRLVDLIDRRCGCSGSPGRGARRPCGRVRKQRVDDCPASHWCAASLKRETVHLPHLRVQTKRPSSAKLTECHPRSECYGCGYFAPLLCKGCQQQHTSAFSSSDSSSDEFSDGDSKLSGQSANHGMHLRTRLGTWDGQGRCAVVECTVRLLRRVGLPVSADLCHRLANACTIHHAEYAAVYANLFGAHAVATRSALPTYALQASRTIGLMLGMLTTQSGGGEAIHHLEQMRRVFDSTMDPSAPTAMK